MDDPRIEEFGRLLVTEVRDRAIRNCDMLLNPNGQSPAAKRWREKGYIPNGDELARAMIMDCVDQALFYLLESIDSGALRLSFVTSAGSNVDLTEDGVGELAGWYAGVQEWVAKYSKERFVDDFKDLSLE